MKNKRRLANDEGSVMLVAMLVMLLLTLIGFAAIQGSVFEIKIAGNQKALDEEFARAETALNLAIRNFRRLTEITGSSSVGESDGDENSMAALLNDTDNPQNNTVKCIRNLSLDGVTLAVVEVRRIYQPDTPDQSKVPGLSDPANAVPELSHRYYDGSIDRKRFAVTATAMRRGTTLISNTWVQKGVALPAEQDRDLF